ncbi:TRAM domain-containing protein [candidate division KSB1 bacterium]|nr:TRAM domain-containing protein [candidate division KSB1 bacterium]
MGNNVPEPVKTSRLNEVSTLQRSITAKKNQEIIGKTVKVMIETVSKRSPEDMLGKTDGGKNVIVPNVKLNPGAFFSVRIVATSSQTLFGQLEEVLDDNGSMTN